MDDYIINGAKTYITSGVRADYVVTAARTGGPGAAGVSLIVVDKDTPGFEVTRKLDKMGWRSSDTAELSYTDVRVPAANLIGGENTRLPPDRRARSSPNVSAWPRRHTPARSAASI